MAFVQLPDSFAARFSGACNLFEWSLEKFPSLLLQSGEPFADPAEPFSSICHSAAQTTRSRRGAR